MRTSKLLCTVACLAFLAAGVSCNKEAPGAAGKIAGNDGKLCTVTFSLNNLPTTKAVTTGSNNDSAVNRIDIFEYDGSEVVTLHYTLTAEELAAKSFQLKCPYGATRGYLIFANLPTALHAKIEAMSLYNLQRQRFRWEDVFDGTYFPMVGFKYVGYYSDQEVSVDLYRYMYRVDVGDIVVNFDDESWMSKDVFVKNILLANVSNTGYLAKFNSFSYFATDNLTPIFGGTLNISNETPIFGNLNAGYAGFENSYYSSTVSCFLPGGSLTNTTNAPTLANVNYRKQQRVLNIDVTGALLTATVQSYNNDSGEGRVCSSTNPSQSHTLAVNKSFYAWMGCCSAGQYPLLCIYDNQNSYPKLVVELSVDGVSYYYPIQMYYPQPNTVYSIDQITIKSAGSDYSNFYEKKIALEMDITVQDWTEVTFNNINAGFTDETQTGIYN